MTDLENSVHNRANRMFGTLLLVQWIGVLCISLVVAQSAFVQHTLSPTLLGFAAGSIIALMTLAQVVAFRTWKSTVQTVLRHLILRQSRIEQNNQNLEHIIRERTRDFLAARRALKQELQNRQPPETNTQDHAQEMPEQVIRPSRRFGKRVAQPPTAEIS